MDLSDCGEVKFNIEDRVYAGKMSQFGLLTGCYHRVVGVESGDIDPVIGAERDAS
ncbi:hypothetical protein BDV38DRAFT_237661 [Aspergillus pseudotamarii]|uniref:Uncharacterized protein n=1 Tax=Aspergillus pseudotamarii TaxID=132259 RepID=A0A5N6T513_ASPPS|nr:uncharacterized protein BDV38DRAFT_237661 [Aspergillus pseudotamarii]KAE8141281.1 hypothetical protein BDV38DRAFT_237661 [Aspergillus pseudotamarii]